MKILHADTDDLGNPLRGGAPIRTFEINKRLAHKHEITVLTATYPGAKRLVREKNITYKRLGIHIPPFGLSPHLSYLARLGPYLKQHSHDLVIEEFMPPVGFCGLPWSTDKPVISLVQWYFFDFWEKKYHLPFTRWMKKIAAKKRYHYFIVQSNRMGENIQQLIPNAVIKKIPCGINDDVFVAKEEQSYGDFVLFLGRLDIWQKGLDTLLKAWQMCSRDQSIKLKIAGGGPAEQLLKKKVRDMGLEHLISFCGPVHGQEKQQLLANCRFMVMPSREETFGLVALEAMAAGKAVVAFDIDHLNELLHHKWSYLIPHHNAESLARVVCDLWSNMHKCKTFGSRGYEQAKQYNWQQLAKQQEQFYQDVLKEHTI